MSRIVDLTGQKFGKLLVIGLNDARGRDGSSRWRCQCECGNETIVARKKLLDGMTKSCGCLRSERTIDITGMKFGRLMVISRFLDDKRRGALWNCLCECGRETVALGGALRRGAISSCGCLRKDALRSQLEDLVRQKFNKLTVLSEHGVRRKQRIWKCVCECGQEELASTNALKSGLKKQCSNCRDGATNIVGKRYGKTIVLGKSRTRTESNLALYHCRCDCGNEFDTYVSKLISQGHCGCEKYVGKPIGHKFKKKNGYVMIKVKNDLRASINNYRYEHVVVIESMMGRSLQEGETVHHKNGLRWDNRPENLELWESSHRPGQRISDVIDFCTKYLSKYAPERLSVNFR